MHDEQTAIQAHDEKQCDCLGEASLQTIFGSTNVLFSILLFFLPVLLPLWQRLRG
jgi:hypothetical protein